jgi:hypothetical protein
LVPSFAFDFNLRRYIQASLADFALTVDGLTVGSEVTGVLTFHCGASTVVGRCSLTLSKSVLKAPMISALQTRKLLSFLAFNFTLRRYTVAAGFGAGYAPTHVACHVIDTRLEASFLQLDVILCRGEQHLPGWRITRTTSTRIVNPRLLSRMAASDAACYV